VILSLPQGYETVVREQGNNFSAGQRQRLSIARAILRDSPILILDEPTANLDVEAEAEVMHALQTLIVGRTVLMISHRLSTLGQVDEIIVLHKGRIVEHGTYDELKAAGGVFAYLLAEQNRYNLDRREDQVPRRPARGPSEVGPQSASSPNGRRPRGHLLKRRGILYRVRTRSNGSVAVAAQGASAMHSTDRPLNGR
jgi:ABC-type multidrug transport system ATPase subunit